RMSEDIDIKLVPTENFMQNGRDKRRKIRKEIVQIITDVIHNSDIFSLDNENARITRDEYRYNEISVRYPQT
ncbi:nucleotidyl transferase AbiEii/AbiGii toxin family protein, partial [Klebsiella pneumoniae]